ncbi:MAG: TatD-related deoxyribonuclease [Oligoflexia bacterium]|nr:MAG: TatD-related deoxyribonuclease [Oligoflexia bacterium]
MTYIDAHSHLADPRLESRLDQVLFNAREKNITQFLQGGVGPEDWRRQLDLQKKYPGILPCFGLHPYWVADHSEAECDQALDELARLLPKAKALGEAGLDFRPHISKGSEHRQIDVFEKQIELAKVAELPLVLHLVRCRDEALRILDVWGLPQRGAMVHSFNGSAKEAEEYLQLGCHLSVGGPLCRPDNLRLKQAVQMIPMDRLFIETDSPDQPPPGIEPEHNEPATLIQVAEEVGKIRKISTEEVLKMTTENLRKWLVHSE